jgi:hypothetical protein
MDVTQNGRHIVAFPSLDRKARGRVLGATQASL